MSFFGSLFGIFASAPDDEKSIQAANAALDAAMNAGNFNVSHAQKIFARAERALGKDHPDTLSSMCSLAVSHQAVGQTEQAERLYRDVLDISRFIFNTERANTFEFISINNLSMLYADAGRTDEVAPLLKRAITSNERIFGKEHQNTVDSLTRLADFYIEAGRYEEGEPLLERALEVNESVLGPDDPATLISMHNLATLYTKTGRSAQAEPLFERAFEISERVAGPDDELTLLLGKNVDYIDRTRAS